MTLKNDQEIIFTLGLNSTEKSRINQEFDHQTRVINYTTPELENLEHDSEKEPLLVFIPWRVWKNLPDNQSCALQQSGRRLVMVNPQQPESNLGSNQLLSQCILGIISPGFNKDELKKALSQAREYKDLREQMQTMTQGIHLEREILDRKNMQLQFLNSFMHQVSTSLDPELILSKAARELTEFIPVQQMGAVFWDATDQENLQANILLPQGLSLSNRLQWGSHLLQEIKKMRPRECEPQERYFVYQGLGHENFCADNILDIPLRQQEQPLGLISLQIKDLQHLGQDILQTVSLAANHLSLALHNSLKMSRAKKLADHDHLTGLYNRHYFDQELKLEKKRHQRQNQPLGLLFLDIDHFKILNDNYGHQAGDLALQELGRLLQSSLRETDTAARYGGEEFVLLLPDTTEDQATVLAERLRRAVNSMQLNYKGLQLHFTVSIGVTSTVPACSQAQLQLIEQADLALYMAKKSGRNRVCKASQQSICHSKV